MKNYLRTIAALLIVNLSQAQSIGINETSSLPEASAILDISSTTKGMLIPRMTTIQRTGIATPATGLLVYDTDTQSFWFKNSTEWINLISSNGWTFSGNTAGNNDFIGTTNNQSLVFKANNLLAGKIDLPNSNTFWGYRAGISNTSGSTNSAVGTEALNSNKTGYSNTAIGFHALVSNISGFNNNAIGVSALNSNTTGYSNVANGAGALYYNTTGYNNTANGSSSLRENTTGFDNTAGGNLALSLNTEGFGNTATGSSSLYSNSTGIGNTANGTFALYYNNTGNSNTAFGYLALASNTTGSSNTASGVGAGSSNATGSNNTFIGFATGVFADGYTNSTAIGSSAIVNASNKVRIGNSAVTIIEGQVAWSTPSDRRLKENIIENNRLGLNFITKLKPVSYNYISDKTKVRHDGFIAQDVGKILNYLHIPFSGLKKSGNGMYSLAYSNFIMPMVNAIKEQQTQIEGLKKESKIFENRIAALENLNLENSKNLSAKK